MEWPIIILFASWIAVALFLMGYLIWETAIRTPHTKEEVEAQAIREHIAAETKSPNSRLTVIQ